MKNNDPEYLQILKKPAEVLLHGETRHGALYGKGAAAPRREWRGIKDTSVDFYEWAKIRAMLLAVFGASPRLLFSDPALRDTAASLFDALSMTDRSTQGLRGRALRMHRRLFYVLFRDAAEYAVRTAGEGAEPASSAGFYDLIMRGAVSPRGAAPEPEAKRFGEENEYELYRQEVNQTPHPQLFGPACELFSKWISVTDCGRDPRIPKFLKKADRLMMKAYSLRDEPWEGKMKYRALFWSDPPRGYADFSAYLADCWGVCVLTEADPAVETPPPAEDFLLRCRTWHADLAFCFEDASAPDNLPEEEMQLFADTAAVYGIRLCRIRYDSAEGSAALRKRMREEANDFMRTGAGAEPADPSLLDITDTSAW